MEKSDYAGSGGLAAVVSSISLGVAGLRQLLDHELARNAVREVYLSRAPEVNLTTIREANELADLVPGSYALGFFIAASVLGVIGYVLLRYAVNSICSTPSAISQPPSGVAKGPDDTNDAHLRPLGR
ncbi:MAG TPA: hypothetical protein HA224_00995 [Nanoarchaeota archaeon]|nr:hypothetical protein [Nanoarchaeota archaeon]